MNRYAPPEAELSPAAETSPSLGRRLVMFPVFALGGLVSSAAAFFLFKLVPIWSWETVVVVAALAAICGAAMWWRPLARTYGKHAYLAGAAVGAVPAGLRIWSLQRWPSGTPHKIVALVDTVGVLLAFAAGAAVVARSLSANNSSKPTPLRGAA
ncbi:hypothetical protein PAGU2595_026650 [Lysobacter xanthus]